MQGAVSTAQSTGKVAPPSWTLLVHRHRVAIAPDQIHRDVTQQLVARPISVRIDPLQNLSAGRRLGLEIAPDYRRQLPQSLKHREVQVGTEVGREDETVGRVSESGGIEEAGVASALT
jgi:hypothetical protein